MGIGILAVGEGSNQSPARDIPQVHVSVLPTHGQASAIRGKADGPSARRSVGERDKGTAAGQLPEVAPLPASQVVLAGLRPVPIQQPARSAEIVQLERLLREIHIRRVEQPTRLPLVLRGLLRLGIGPLPLGLGLGLLSLRLAALRFLAVSRHFGFPLCFPGLERLPNADPSPATSATATAVAAPNTSLLRRQAFWNR